MSLLIIGRRKMTYSVDQHQLAIDTFRETSEYCTSTPLPIISEKVSSHYFTIYICHYACVFPQRCLHNVDTTVVCLLSQTKPYCGPQQQELYIYVQMNSISPCEFPQWFYSLKIKSSEVEDSCHQRLPSELFIGPFDSLALSKIVCS